MDKARKKNMKRIIYLVCIVTMAALLAAMPLIAKQNTEEDGPKASILSGTVTVDSIDNKLIGGGQLAEEDAVAVSIPAAVKLKEFLVSNGDFVTEGTPIATVDRVTVMKAISQVQETLEYLSEQIEKAGDSAGRETVTALAGGSVKILYAQKGDSVQSVMLEHGALAVLSLDGLMAVNMDVESALPVGTAVTVTFSDGATAAGKIAKNLAGEMTVTVEDQGYAVDDEVQVSQKDGTFIGNGRLYIYSPWNATAYAGTVDSVKVRVGDTLRAGKTLMVLEDVGYSAAYRQLISQRQEYEEMMLDLFKMYQTETVTAPCDGAVSGIDQNSVQLLSASGSGYVVKFLTNAPSGDDETLYSNYVGQVTGISAEGWGMNLNPQPFLIDDYLVLSGVSLDTSLMTQSFLHTRTDTPIYTLSGGTWVQVSNASISAGDILLFAEDSSGCLVWGVLLQKVSQPDIPEDPAEPSEPINPSDPTTPSDPTAPTDPTTPGNPSMPGNPGFTIPSGGSWGGMMDQTPAFETYSLEMADIAAVTPQDTMTLNITVDELDIKALQLGMTAQVRINALGGEKYTATIAEIGNTGTSNGGSSKYTVKLIMDRAGDMLSGMNATATIALATVTDVLTIPAYALVEKGNTTIVYIGYNEETKTLENPVEIRTGISDGETVEVLEGLENGQTYYYAYYDTLEVSFTPDFGGMSMFG